MRELVLILRNSLFQTFITPRAPPPELEYSPTTCPATAVITQSSTVTTDEIKISDREGCSTQLTSPPL